MLKYIINKTYLVHPLAIPPDCDGYPEGASWQPQPCETCSCESGQKICILPGCDVPCANPIAGEGACCPTCPPTTTEFPRKL